MFLSLDAVHLGSFVRKEIAAEIDAPGIISMIDESDRKFYDVAKNSDSILITVNIKHYPQESFVHNISV